MVPTPVYWALVLGGVATQVASLAPRRLVGDERTFLVINSPPQSKGSFVCEPANFGPRFPVKPGITASFAKADPENLCEDPTNAVELQGKVVLVDRGDCYFVDKIKRAEAVGAKAVVVANNVYSPEHVLMGAYANASATSIPACLVSKRDAQFFEKHWEKNVDPLVTIKDGQTEVLTINGHQASFQVYVDGVREEKTSGFESGTATYTIRDDYSVVAIAGFATVRTGESALAVRATDKFSSGPTWRCTSTEPDAETWATLKFKETADWKQASTSGENPDLTPADNIWASDRTSAKVWCRGYRYLEAVYVDGYKYQYNDTKLTWQEAEDTCRSAFPGFSGHLASIHSHMENSVVHSLIPPTLNSMDGAWIGLNDIVKENEYIWSDTSKADYSHWREGEPNNRNDEEDCVQMDTTSTWNDLSCVKHERPFVCQARVGHTDDEPIPDDPTDANSSTCLVYWTDSANPMTFQDFLKKAELLNAPTGPDDLCKYPESGLSCCSAQYINTAVQGIYDFSKRGVTSQSCLDTLQQVACYQCDPSSGAYTRLSIEGVTMNFCEDTCVTMWESCKDDPKFAFIDDDNTIKDAKHLCDIIDALDKLGPGHVNFDIVPSDRQDCFKVDNLPPLVHQYTPVNNTRVTSSAQHLTVQFNEQVLTNDGQIVIRDHRGEVRHKIDMAKPESVYFTKTVWTDDTMHIIVSDECAFEHDGPYHVEIPPDSVVDTAGNVWFGNKGTGFKWIVKGTGSDCDNGKGHSLGWLWAIFVMLLLGGVGAGYYYWKKKRDASLSYNNVGGMEEGDLVATDTGLHQLRLVPVYNPDDGDPSAAPANEDKEASKSMLSET